MTERHHLCTRPKIIVIDGFAIVYFRSNHCIYVHIIDIMINTSFFIIIQIFDLSCTTTRIMHRIQPLITRFILMIYDIRDAPLQSFITLRVRETKTIVSLEIFRGDRPIQVVQQQESIGRFVLTHSITKLSK